LGAQPGSGVAESTGDTGTLQRGLEEAAQRLKAEGRELTQAARALASLARPAVLQNPKRLGAMRRALERALAPERRERLGLAELWAQIEQYEREAPQRLRRAVSRTLKEACERAGLELRVISQEEPVQLRIPPLSVELDFAAGKATLGFARSALVACALSVERILAAREAVLQDLDRPLDPREFFERVRRAYQLALIESGGREGDRIEIAHVLPFVALLMQGTGFQRDPTRATFRSYGRAHFAYDVLRLRRQGGLAQDGLRLNLGVATGVSASQPGRAIYFEDEYGAGEFKLTLYFTCNQESGP
jgi:hypothetical protein